MRAVGDLWARDELTVAEEHLATAITYRVMHVLGSTSERAAPSRERVMRAALAQERHVLGLQMVADTLESAGFVVQLLGADVLLEPLAAAGGPVRARGRGPVDHDARRSAPGAGRRAAARGRSRAAHHGGG